MRQARPWQGSSVLARIVLEPLGLEPSWKHPCQFISELITQTVRWCDAADGLIQQRTLGKQGTIPVFPEVMAQIGSAGLLPACP
jgi:hypothetical protein